METFETPKHRPSSWYYACPLPARFGMDVWRRCNKPCCDASRCQPAWARESPSLGVQSRVNFYLELSDVAEGLYFLHSRNVVHGDLKGVRYWHDIRSTVVLTLPSQTSSWIATVTRGSRISVLPRLLGTRIRSRVRGKDTVTPLDGLRLRS